MNIFRMKKEKSYVLGKNKQDKVKRKKKRFHKQNERLNSKLKKNAIYKAGKRLLSIEYKEFTPSNRSLI